MEKIILVDSCCNLPIDFFEQHDFVKMIGMPIDFNGEELIDRYDNGFDLKRFYEALSDGAISKTSQITPQRFVDFFDSNLEKEIYYIGFSSGMSGTIESSIIAKEDANNKNVHIIDSRCASVGYGALIYDVVEAYKNDKNLDIEQYVTDKINFIQHVYTVSDLMYLKRGGRIPATAAAIGTVINMKPIMSMNQEGKLISYKKARGMKKAIKTLYEEFVEREHETKTLFIGHANAHEHAVELKNKIQSDYPNVTIIINEESPTIGSHVGPGLLVIGFIGERR